MELVSETEEQTRVLGDATVRTRCLAMFATPIRERAAKNKYKVKLRIQRDGGYFFGGVQNLHFQSFKNHIRLSAMENEMKKSKLASLTC